MYEINRRPVFRLKLHLHFFFKFCTDKLREQHVYSLLPDNLIILPALDCYQGYTIHYFIDL